MPTYSTSFMTIWRNKNLPHLVRKLFHQDQGSSVEDHPKVINRCLQNNPSAIDPELRRNSLSLEEEDGFRFFLVDFDSPIGVPSSN